MNNSQLQKLSLSLQTFQSLKIICAPNLKMNATTNKVHNMNGIFVVRPFCLDVHGYFSGHCKVEHKKS